LHQFRFCQVVEVLFFKVLSVLTPQYLVFVVIVPGSLIGIAEHIVGLENILEDLCSVLVWVLVRVPLKC